MTINIKKFFTATANPVAAVILVLATLMPAQAQDSTFNELPLNGIARYEQLRHEYYIGGLYLQSSSQEASSVIGASNRKRMEMRITIDKWPRRRFAQLWNQAILINNPQESLEEFADQILAFTDFPQDDLVAGDRIIIDMDSNQGTFVYLNGNKVLETDKPEFFDLLLNVWIGQRPPSSDFKNNILTLPTDQAGTDLLARYEITKPAAGREKLTAAWVKPENLLAKTKVAAAPVAVAKPAPEVKTPPPSAAAPVIALAKPEVSTPALKVEIEKPVAAAITKPEPVPAKPAPVPVAAAPAPAPKPAPPPPAPTPVAAAPTPAPVVPTANAEQEKMLKAYRSNVLKLTYLNTQYPKRAMDFKQEGLVVLNVKLDRTGKVIDIVEQKSSEHQLLNKAARSAVKKTAPYPEAPKTLLGEVIEVSLPFNFKL